MIFPRETAFAAIGADWMILVTNDGWFGDWVGPMQHLAMAQFRAIETGLPIARSANAGVSAMIDPFGRTINAIGPGKAGIVDSALPAKVETFYFKIGEAGTTVVFLHLLLLATYGRKRSKKAVNSHV